MQLLHPLDRVTEVPDSVLQQAMVLLLGGGTTDPDETLTSRTRVRLVPGRDSKGICGNGRGKRRSRGNRQLEGDQST